MTTKMQSCVDHIKTSLDVDPCAAKMVEKIFTEYDRRFDKVLEIISRMGISNAYDRPSFWFNKGKDYKVIDTKYNRGYDQALEDIEREVLTLKGGEQE